MAHQVAVAAAESAAFEATAFDAPIDRARLAAEFAGLIAGPWWHQCFAGSPPVVSLVTPPVRTQTSTARSVGGGFEIRVADGQLSLSTLAHELGHVLAGLSAQHDPLFRAAYADAAAAMAGTELGDWLREAFAGFGLPVAERRWPPPFAVSGGGFVVR